MKPFESGEMQLVPFFPPVNMATAANTGDWINMAKFKHCAIVLLKAIGTAGEDPTITVQQATAAAGTNAKALNFTKILVKQGALFTAIGQFTRVTQTAANTYTEATSAEAQALWVIEIDADELDVDNGFTFVQASVGDVGTDAQIGTAFAILSGASYVEDPAPSAIA
jgi:hypothetical protein